MSKRNTYWQSSKKKIIFQSMLLDQNIKSQNRFPAWLRFALVLIPVLLFTGFVDPLITRLPASYHIESYFQPGKISTKPFSFPKPINPLGTSYYFETNFVFFKLIFSQKIKVAHTIAQQKNQNFTPVWLFYLGQISSSSSLEEPADL